MSKKILLLSIIILLVIVGGFFWLWRGEEEAMKTVEQMETEAILAPEVEAVLTKKIQLITEFLQDQTIIDEVKKSNEKNGDLSHNEILRLDKQWRSIEGVDEWINSFLINMVAFKLIEFQEKNYGFPEIFITDMYGLNVGQTNKTTDYYQADEDWWVASFDEGRGRALHGPIEFDESAQAEAIAIYVPIMDPETNKAIGVAKAIVDIVAIKAEL